MATARQPVPQVIALPFAPATGQKTAAPSAFDSTTLHAPTPPSASTLTCASNVKGSTRLRQVPAVATSLEGHYPHTPIDVAHLESELHTHPDQAWCSRLLHTLRHGASIGYHGPCTPRTSKNLQSATLHPDIIDNELQSECAKGQLARPYNSPPLPNLQCSGVGVVPKKDGSWRMIMHLSGLHLNSINDGIDKEPYLLHFSTIDNATLLIAEAGPGCFLSKINIKGAFRLIPVSRHDWELLGIHWRGSY